MPVKSRIGQLRKARDAKGRFRDTFNIDLAVRICERVALGETLTAICKEAGMPDRTTFRSWVLRDETLRKAYDAAKELKAQSLFDEALDIARELKVASHDNAKVRALQVAIDTLKWAASKLNPREYGEKPPPQPIVAVVIKTSLDLGRAGLAIGSLPGEALYQLKAPLTIGAEPADSPGTAAESGQEQTADEGAPALIP